MKSSIVLGYKDLFPDQQDNYESLLSGLPSQIVIRICSAFNNELNGPGGLHDNQQMIINAIIHRFTYEQRKDLQERVNAYNERTEHKFSTLLFGARYFIDMIVQELNHPREISDHEDESAHEYHFFKAYLLIVDGIAIRDSGNIDFDTFPKDDPQNLLRLLWLPVLTQFEYNERASQLFETYKTFCFFKFMLAEYPIYLKEYLESSHFSSVGGYMTSYKQIMMTITNFDSNAHMLQRLNYIVPLPDADQTLLQKLSVNLLTKKRYSLNDVKKAPLFYVEDRAGYMVIDYNFATKKMFRGAFFEICHQTSLTQGHEYSKEEKENIFNTYSSRVSDAFERNYFKPIMELFSDTTADCAHFDDRSLSVPDCYLRIGNRVFLFEYKAYVFPEKLAAKPDFDEFISYLDEKFANGKGISQLVNQIDLVAKHHFNFDGDLIKIYQEHGIIIYPVIVYNDFNYSTPGINSYLNNKFLCELQKLKANNISIAPLVMVNLETIMDLAITNKNIADLEQGFHQYFNFLNDYSHALVQKPNQNNLLRANSSFDEFYNSRLIQKTDSQADVHSNLQILLLKSGIDLNDFNIPI